MCIPKVKRVKNPSLFLHQYTFPMHRPRVRSISPLADLRGRQGHASLSGVQILLVSCSFWEHLGQLCIGDPPREVGAPTSVKSCIRHCKSVVKLVYKGRWLTPPGLLIAL